jgi:hypothetical protein
MSSNIVFDKFYDLWITIFPDIPLYIKGQEYSRPNVSTAQYAELNAFPLNSSNVPSLVEDDAEEGTPYYLFLQESNVQLKVFGNGAFDTISMLDMLLRTYPIRKKMKELEMQISSLSKSMRTLDLSKVIGSTIMEGAKITFTIQINTKIYDSVNATNGIDVLIMEE